jgi:hypothetical protein
MLIAAAAAYQQNASVTVLASSPSRDDFTPFDCQLTACAITASLIAS